MFSTNEVHEIILDWLVIILRFHKVEGEIQFVWNFLYLNYWVHKILFFSVDKRNPKIKKKVLWIICCFYRFVFPYNLLNDHQLFSCTIKYFI
jgi:hypothetical protein